MPDQLLEAAPAAPPALARALAALLADHRRRILAALGTPPSLSNIPLALWQALTLETQAALAQALPPVFGRALNATVKVAKALQGVEPAPSPNPPRAALIGQTWAARRAATVAALLTQHTKDRIAALLAPAEGPVPTAKEVKVALPDILGPARADRIATTEAKQAQSAGKITAIGEAKRQGADLVPVWWHQGATPPQGAFTLGKTHPCAACSPLIGTGPEIWSAFVPGGPPYHPGCDCSLRIMSREEYNQLLAGRRGFVVGGVGVTESLQEGFCKTGEGGGVDNSCGDKDGGSSEDKPAAKKPKTADGPDPKTKKRIMALEKEAVKYDAEIKKKGDFVDAKIKAGWKAKAKELRAEATKLRGAKRDVTKSTADVGFLTGTVSKRETRETAAKLLGPDLDDSTFASIVGATDDSKVRVMANKELDSVIIQTDHDEYWSKRRISRDSAGVVFVENVDFRVNNKSQGNGLGSDVFTNQVTNAQEAGVGYIKCHAAKMDADGKPGFNGFYTWPRLGYDAPLPPLVKAGIQKRFKGVETVLDLMQTKEGRNYWKAHGTDLHDAKFDLTPGSRSLQVLNAYLEERKNRG